MSQLSPSPGRAGGLAFPFPTRRSSWLLSLLLTSHLVSWGQAKGALPSAPARTTRPTQATSLATPGRTTVQYAKGFRLAYVGNCKVISIQNPFETQAKVVRYLLVPRGAARPAGYPDAQVIETPLRSLVGLSSLHVALADFLGAADLVVGVGSFKYVSAPRVRQRMAAGQVYEVGQGKELNNELLVAHHPDLVMATGWPGEGLDHFQTLRAAGVPVLINSEWVETTPLARAEWVKVLAALLNKEAVVNQKFDAVAREYQRLAALGRRAAKQPSVVVGLPFKDVWYVPDADSYMAQFLRDAGAAYHWNRAKAPSGSLALSFEAVAPVALGADYWLQTGTLTTKAALLAQDARYAAFAPVQSGRIFNNNLRTNAQGSNDYWESGAVHPDLILADLLYILHPELLPTWTLRYYRPLR
ncbi:MAG: ABC transporter substrate-binding protein [Cytophagaceae bacterium]|nr:MAG: ABC transporter substrate-binding protein [Cytophagaceae bacterium]